MSAITRPGLAPVQGVAAPAPTTLATVAGPVTQVRVVRAEWTKLRALRSTRWSALTAVVLIVGLGAIEAGASPGRVMALIGLLRRGTRCCPW